MKFQIPNVLSEENICRSEIPWNPNGVDPNNAEHADYLKDTIEIFKSEIISLIEANSRKQRRRSSDTGKHSHL